MSFQTSFKQILREKMGQTPSENPSNTSRIEANDPAHLAFLMGTIHRFEFNSPRGHYPAPKVRPQRKSHNFTEDQRLSFDYLKTWSQDLSEGFTATELKKAFRQAALAAHPDQGGSAQQFVEVREHYKNLVKLISK